MAQEDTAGVPLPRRLIGILVYMYGRQAERHAFALEGLGYCYGLILSSSFRVWFAVLTFSGQCGEIVRMWRVCGMRCILCDVCVCVCEGGARQHLQRMQPARSRSARGLFGLTASKASSARSLSFGFLSGCTRIDSFRNCFLTVRSSAPGSICNTFWKVMGTKGPGIRVA